MQRGRSALNFPEPFDLNQGSVPENTSIDHSTSWSNMLNPVEHRISNYMLAANDGNASCINAADSGNSQSFSGWDCGESSSSANNMQDGSHGADPEPRVGWSSSFNARAGLDARSDDWSFPTYNANSTSSLVTGRPPITQNFISNGASVNLNLNDGQVGDHDCHRGPGPSFGSWSSSCKRKALEGTSGQFYPGGSSSSNQPVDKNMLQHLPHGCHNTLGDLSISSGPVNMSSTNLVERVNPCIEVGMSRGGPSPFSTVPGFAENPGRHVRSNHVHHEPMPFDTPRSSSMRTTGVYTSQLLRPITNTDSADLRSSIAQPVNYCNSLNQPHLQPVNEARGTHSYSWNGSLSSRGGSSSSSFVASGERGSRAPEEINVRSSRRNNLEYPMTVSAPETRNVLPDQIDWSFAPGTSASSRNIPSGSRVGPSSGGRTYSGAWPHQIWASQNHQRISESSPWTPFPRAEAGMRRIPVLPSATPSLDEAPDISRQRLALAAQLMDTSGDYYLNNWRASAAVEGRHRLIRQVLNAMRRGVHLQAEDYMLIDPLINGFPELQDRHRDMRLDVDNMSYEELLALEEQIGNVSTGLREDQIRSYMKQHKYETTRGSLPNKEPCCICQENYITGEVIGILDCGHDFHSACIKQWLTLKNLCPICKMTGLKT